jgi:hypothetical protein
MAVTDTTAGGDMVAKETKLELEERLDRISEAGMAKTRRYYTMWNENLRYFFSDQLHGHPQRKNWEWVTLNYIWPSAMQEIAKLTKNNPKVIVQPWEESDTEASEVWENKLQWDWKQGINGHGMRLEQVKAILDGKLYGYRVSRIYWEPKCYWNDETQEWEGDVKHKLWHPSLFWADADECIDDGNCGIERYATLEWAIDHWPKYKKELTNEAVSYKEIKESFEGFTSGGRNSVLRGQKTGTASEGFGGSDFGPDRDLANNQMPNRLLDIITGVDPMTHEPEESNIKLVKIQEMYLKDYTEKSETIEEDVPAEVLLEDGTIYESGGAFYFTEGDKPVLPEDWPTVTVETKKIPLFPRGRHIIRVGKTILNPKLEDQKHDLARWPFVVTPHYIMPHAWQGIDSVQLYKDTQDMINVSASHLYNNLKQFGDPKIAVETGAIETPPGQKGKHYKIGAGAGSIIRLAKGALSRGSFKILDPPQPPPMAIQLYQMFAQEYKNIQGMHSIAQGQKTPGKMSATESVHLATSSVDRIALQAIYEDYWVVECCKLIAEMEQKNYDLGRWVRIVGEDNVAGAQQITEGLKNVKFDISIIPGTTLPFDEEKRAAKYMEAYKLMSNPQPNPMLPEILKVMEIPKWKKLLMQHEGWQKYMGFQSMLEALKAGKADPQQIMQTLAQQVQQAAGQHQQQVQQEVQQGLEKSQMKEQMQGGPPAGQPQAPPQGGQR